MSSRRTNEKINIPSKKMTARVKDTPKGKINLEKNRRTGWPLQEQKQKIVYVRTLKKEEKQKEEKEENQRKRKKLTKGLSQQKTIKGEGHRMD